MSSSTSSSSVDPAPSSLLLSGCAPVIQNVVCSSFLGCVLDLKGIALRARNTEYNPKRFSAVIMKLREPHTTALLFHNGKMVCTGARSEEDALLASKKFVRIIQRVGYPQAVLGDFKVQNLVGCADVRFPVRLEGLALEHDDYCVYESELFPGLIYRMIRPKIAVIIFVNGKVVFTGAKSQRDINTAFEIIYPLLRRFRKANAALPDDDEDEDDEGVGRRNAAGDD